MCDRPVYGVMSKRCRRTFVVVWVDWGGAMAAGCDRVEKKTTPNHTHRLSCGLSVHSLAQAVVPCELNCVAQQMCQRVCVDGWVGGVCTYLTVLPARG